MTQPDFTEHRSMLSNSVADFARGADLARVRKLREGNPECDRKVWTQMAELGWLGVLAPEASGGMGLKLGDMAIVAQGLARALTPEPVGLRSTWLPAKMQTLRLGSSRPSPPSVRIVP